MKSTEANGEGIARVGAVAGLAGLAIWVVEQYGSKVLQAAAAKPDCANCHLALEFPNLKPQDTK